MEPERLTFTSKLEEYCEIEAETQPRCLFLTLSFYAT